nr:hypothetical protein [uncultured Agathobacter sp.]
MKVFYTKTYNVWNDNTRKQDIVAQAAKQLNCDEVSLFKFDDTYDSDDELHVRMQGITAAVSRDSIVIFQYPSMVSARYDGFVMEHLKNICGAKVAVIVEDLGSRIAPSDYKQLSDEINLFNKADLLIVQSTEMELYLKENGLKKMPVMYQRVWDYPYDFYLDEQEIDKKVEQIHDISMQHMLDLKKAGLALTATTDRENKYDLMINPFETGFCICACIPMIVPEQTNVAEFVSRYGIGFVMSDCENIDDVLNRISDGDIAQAQEQEKKLAPAVAEGMFTKLMLQEVVCRIIDNTCLI